MPTPERETRKHSANAIILASLLGVAGLATAGAKAEPVVLNVIVTIDQVSPGSTARVGQRDRLRIAYDDDAVDPSTHRVTLLNMQHFNYGAYAPAHPDPVYMPVTDAWLDLSSKPYRLHFRAAVVHGMPIIITADEHTRRLAIFSQSAPHTVLQAGPYQIDPAPIRGAVAIAATTDPSH